MGIWQKIKSKVKQWLGGGRSSSGGGGSKATPPRARVQYNNRDARRQVISSRTSASGRGRVLIDVDDKKEEKRVADAFKATTHEYKDTAATLKRPSQSPYERQAEASKKAREDITAAFKKPSKSAYERQADNLNAAKEKREANRERLKSDLKEIKEKRQEKHEAFHSATSHRYDVAEKGISKEERNRRKQNIRTAPLGELVGGRDNEALDVMKAKMKYDKIGESFKRGAVDTATASATRLLASKLPESGRKEAEEYYQKNKSRLAEGAGNLVGGMALYGGTANTFEGLGENAIGRAAETNLGRRLGAEALKRTMAGEGAKAAFARSLVGDAIQDSTIGALESTMDVASRDDLETPSDYAKAWLKSQGLNYGMGLAGNVVAHGLPVVGRAIGKNWGDFADESRKLRFVPKDTMDFMDDFANDVGSGAGRNLVMNGGTTKASRLQGFQYWNGKAPKKLAKAPKPTAPNTEAQVVRKPSEILQGYLSTGSKKKITDAQKSIRQHIANGDTKAAREELERVVDDVVRNTKTVVPMDDTIREIKEELKNTRISIGDKADVGYKSGSFNEFRKKNFHAFKLTEDGTPVDDLWGSLQKKYGTSLFPDEIDNPSDQLQYLADIAKTTDSKVDLADEEIAYLKDELSNSLWESANKGADSASSASSQYTSEDFFKTLDTDFPAETWLGRYGHITRNEDGTYNLFVNGFGDKTLNRQQVESYIDDAVKRLNADEAASQTKKAAQKAKKEGAPEPPKARKRKPSKSEIRLEEVKAEIREINDEIERLKAAGEDSIESIRKANALYDEQRKLEKNIKRAENAREKRATDKAMKRFEEERAAKEAAEAEVKAEPPKEEAKPEPPKTEEPETAVATREDVAKAGEEAKAEEQAKTGERTEFKRSEEPSAKEQARNKRSEKRAKATQEDFDRDFAEFEKKISENREKVSKLNGRLRAATTAEEKQAIKNEIKALDDEIKRMHRRASLKYHPDMGGSTEWAQKFNGAYDDYTKRVYSSPNFSGASSKSSSSGTRNNTYREYRQRYKNTGAKSGSTPPPKTEAGGGGSTPPPPPRGGKYADYDGLRRPKGYAKRTQRAMENLEDMVGASKTKKTWREALRSFRDEANRKFVDSMKDFEQVARERLKTSGKKAMEELYGAIDKARRYRAVATTSVGSHQMKWDGTRYQVKGKDGVMRDAPSISEIFSGMDKETEKSFNVYLLLNHNIDRLREGKPVFENTLIYNEELSKRLGLGKDIDLMDADVCKKLAQDYEARFPDFQSRAAQVRQYTANELNNRVEAGLLSRETMDEWLHKYPNYVPTYREGLFDGISAVKGGSVGASDLKAAKGSDLNIYDIKEQLADATVRNWRDISLNNLLEKTFGSNIKNLADSAEISPHMFALDHTMNVGKAADGGKYYADVYRNGKAERVEIDKRFYDDLKDLYKNGRMGNGLDSLNDKALVPLANLWKNLITEWSPIFMVKNAMRDFPEAVINSRNRKEFLEITADRSALQDLLHHGQFSESLRDAGISASTFIDIDKAVKDFEKGKGGLKTLIPRLNAGVEMYPRLIEYMATIKKAGYDLKTVKISDIPMEIRDMAAANAADVTVNFGRNGSVGKMINKGFVPFFNPSVQGWSKFARNVTENVGSGVHDTLTFMLSATALGAAPMVITNLLYQNNPNYQRISARDKANNYIIAIPPFDDNADTFIKIPRSRFASVYGLPLVNVANENKANWATAIQIVNDQVAPINPLESYFGANLIQAARNKTWYGTPIESEAMESLPANERYDATTSGISIGAAQALNKATGGKVKVSPKKLDYVLDANFGVAADVGLPLFTKANKGQGALGQIANIGKKAFVIDSATQSDLSSRYYDKATLLEQNKNSSEASDVDKKAYEKYKSWDSRVKGVTNAMRYIQASDLPNKQEAYRELAKLRNDDMQKALDGKVSLNNTRDIDIIHKYAGTSYTIENLGKSADQKALKAYGAAVYGDISDEEMKKRIDSDTEFYKGYKGIAKTQNALQRIDPKLKGGNALTYAVGLADAGANDDVFAAYNTTVKSRTESASKAQRAKDYLNNNGSVQEFAQLENAVKTLGKLSDVDKDRLEDDAYARLKRGEMSIDEYNTELKKIDYNANQSYVGKAVSLAMSGAPNRAYNLYDIKGKNVQKGYNLAAMGIDSRKYREMSQACDKDGNGYLKTAEIREYVANSDIEDKATLFDALCYYNNVRNPFGTPHRYSAEEAAQMGMRNGVKQINVNAGADNTVFNSDKSSSSGYSGYGRRRYGGYRGRRYSGGGGRSAKVPAIKESDFKATKRTYKDTAAALKSTSRSKGLSKTATVKVEPPKVKFKKYEV